jgi:lysozyme
MGKLSPAGLDFIAECEGFSATVYTCPAGKPTIGYGHVVLPGEPYGQPGYVMDEDAALRLLDADAASAVRTVNKSVDVPLEQSQFDALVSLAFNIGSGAFASSTLLRLLNEGDRLAAALEFIKWHKAGGKPLAGLIRRRALETAMFLEG